MRLAGIGYWTGNAHPFLVGGVAQGSSTPLPAVDAIQASSVLLLVVRCVEDNSPWLLGDGWWVLSGEGDEQLPAIVTARGGPTKVEAAA